MIKKLIIGIGLGLSLLGYKANAGLITTNLSAATNIVWTGRVSAYQIDVTSATANLIKVYDTASNALTYVIGAYTGSSNLTANVTNIYTNAIFEYPGVSTQVFKMTNIFLNANIRTNYAVAQSTNNCPAVVTLFCPAGLTTTINGVDMNFLNGITVTATNTAQISIYTR